MEEDIIDRWNDRIGAQLTWKTWGIGLSIGHEQFGGWFLDVQLGPIHVWARSDG